jgi:hypothetical protein
MKPEPYQKNPWNMIFKYKSFQPFLSLELCGGGRGRVSGYICVSTALPSKKKPSVNNEYEFEVILTVHRR